MCFVFLSPPASVHWWDRQTTMAPCARRNWNSRIRERNFSQSHNNANALRMSVRTRVRLQSPTRGHKIKLMSFPRQFIMMISSGVGPRPFRFDAAYEQAVHRVETNHTHTHTLNGETNDAAITSWLDLFWVRGQQNILAKKNAAIEDIDDDAKQKTHAASGHIGVICCVCLWILRMLQALSPQ